MTVAPARLATYRVLRSLHVGRSHLPDAIARSHGALADPRDRTLLTEIATGTTRWRATLDFVIARQARRAVDRLDPEVLDILRLSAYQLLYLSRVPSGAIVSEAVELTRMAGKHSAAGFVNAVLRGIDRARGHLGLPPRPTGAMIPPWPDEALTYLSVTLSHPRWLVERWLERHGYDATESWLHFNNRPAPLTLRANRARIARDELAVVLREAGVSTSVTRYAPDGLIVTVGNPLNTPCFDEGLFVVQDEASQLVALLARPAPGERWLDTCASPGGKATALAGGLEPDGLLVAADRRPGRMRLLAGTVSRTGAGRIRLVRLDLARGLPFADRFDGVFVDVPCSGLGTLRRDPDIKWRRTAADLPDLAAAELLMLEAAAGAVRPGGRLIYATCSSEPDENESVVARFLERQPGFRAADPRHFGDRPVPEGLAAVLNDDGRLMTLPHEHGLEAFFGALLVRTA